MTPVVGGIIKAGLGILGGLFGRKKQTQSTVTDFVKLRESAEAAGFNPLTALRASGGNGFQTTTSPGLSSGEFIANALGVAVDDLVVDPTKKARDDLELKLLQAQLDDLQQSGRVAQGFAADVPVANFYSAGNDPVPGKPALASKGAINGPFDAERLGGIPGDEDLMSAQSAENLFGEWGGELVGAINGARFSYRNLTDPMRERAYGPGSRRTQAPLRRPERYQTRGGMQTMPSWWPF